MFPHKSSLTSLLITALLATAAAGSCYGSSINYGVSSGSGSSQVSAVADFDFDSSKGSLTVTLQNLLPNPTDVKQVITGFTFALSGLSDVASLSDASGDLILLNTSTPTDQGLSALNSWTSTTTLPSHTILLTDLGHGQPKEGIIGGPGEGGTYSAGNGSIVGNAPHNPFVSQIATFVFDNVPGVDSSADISALVSGVQFEFGSAAGQGFQTATQQVNVVNQSAVQSTPEPASALMAIGGLALVAGVRRRRR
jgi:MYXO-CTERM domain-containing protein